MTSFDDRIPAEIIAYAKTLFITWQYVHQRKAYYTEWRLLSRELRRKWILIAALRKAGYEDFR